MSEMNKSHGKGFNFGTERNNMKNVLINNLNTDPNIPGPASYPDINFKKESDNKPTRQLGIMNHTENRFKVKVDYDITKETKEKKTDFYDLEITNLYPNQYKFNQNSKGDPKIIKDPKKKEIKGQRQLMSRNASAKLTKINPPHKGTGENREMRPGPGNYDDKYLRTINSDGKQLLSRHKNSGSRTFGKSERDTFRDRCKTPGPGSYTPCDYSDFKLTKNK